MNPVVKFLSEMADAVFMSAAELTDKINASGLGQANRQAIASGNSEKLNLILSDKEIKALKDHVNALVVVRAA